MMHGRLSIIDRLNPQPKADCHHRLLNRILARIRSRPIFQSVLKQ